jgi:hypothetical protein
MATLQISGARTLIASDPSVTAGLRAQPDALYFTIQMWTVKGKIVTLKMSQAEMERALDRWRTLALEDFNETVLP